MESKEAGPEKLGPKPEQTPLQRSKLGKIAAALIGFAVISGKAEGPHLPTPSYEPPISTEKLPEPPSTKAGK